MLFSYVDKDGYAPPGILTDSSSLVTRTFGDTTGSFITGSTRPSSHHLTRGGQPHGDRATSKVSEVKEEWGPAGRASAGL